MKLTAGSVALLGLPSALAAAVAAHAPASSTTHAPVVNTFTSPSSTSGSASPSKHGATTKHTTPTTTSSSATPGITRLAIFTNGGVAWTITSASGVEGVDGFTLAPGQPQNLGGEMVSERPNGNVYVGGTKLNWETFTASSTMAAPGGSSAAAASASSSVGGGASGSASAPGNGGSGGGSSSTSSNVAAMRTAGVVGVVGAVLGVMVL